MRHIRKHEAWDFEDDAAVKLAIVGFLTSSKNEEHEAVLMAEAKFGSTAFDNGFKHQTADELIDLLQDYVECEESKHGHGGVADFIGTVQEFAGMPVDSLRTRMIQAAWRMGR